jgi:hypothetical protein
MFVDLHRNLLTHCVRVRDHADALSPRLSCSGERCELTDEQRGLAIARSALDIAGISSDRQGMLNGRLLIRAAELPVERHAD